MTKGLNMNYYTFHSGDYLRDTSHLTLIEDAIYRRALDWYYTNESPLPPDFKKIARLIRATDYQQEVETVISEFFVLTENGWSQKRCDEEISIYHEKADKARQNGRLGGRPKAKINQTLTESKPNHNLEITDSVILANQTLTESKANQEPRTNNQEPINNKQTNTREDEKNEQAIIDNLTSEPKNFEMYFGWKPNQQEFLAYKKSYGVTQDLTPEILEEFIRKAHANKEKHNETKWCNFLAKFLKSWINNPTFEKKPNPHIYQPEQQYTPEPPVDRFALPEGIGKPLHGRKPLTEEEKARRKEIVAQARKDLEEKIKKQESNNG